ncbi:hypothetical protein ACP70R_046053 [Stipagrostis hirtigluma subsp. patula]
MKEGTANCVDILIAIILPPLGVFLKFGCKVEFWLCLLLTFLAYLPGIIYAIYAITKWHIWKRSNSLGQVERACSLVVTRASVAPQVLGSTSRGSEFSRIYRHCAFSGRRRARRQRGASGDFVNIEDLPAQSSKMLIGVGFAHVRS